MGTLVAAAPHHTDPPLPASRAERRRLAGCDAASARRAELHAIRDLLTDAASIVGHGWVQHAWFAVATPRGQRLLTAHEVRHVYQYPVTGACLAGSVVLAAGGPDQAHSQLVQRTLDLTWHALRDDTDPPAALCPSPQVRALRLLDLTHWNDAPRRTQGDVVDLLGATRQLAGRHRRFQDARGAPQPALPSSGHGRYASTLGSSTGCCSSLPTCSCSGRSNAKWQGSFRHALIRAHCPDKRKLGRRGQHARERAG